MYRLQIDKRLVEVVGVAAGGEQALGVGKRRLLADEADVAVAGLEQLGGDPTHRLGGHLIDVGIQGEVCVHVLGAEYIGAIGRPVPID